MHEVEMSVTDTGNVLGPAIAGTFSTCSVHGRAVFRGWSCLVRAKPCRSGLQPRDLWPNLGANETFRYAMDILGR